MVLIKVDEDNSQATFKLSKAELDMVMKIKDNKSAGASFSYFSEATLEKAHKGLVNHITKK